MFVFFQKKKNMSIETFTWRNCPFLNKKVKYEGWKIYLGITAYTY